MRPTRALGALLVALALAPAFAPVRAAGWEEATLAVGGQERPYRVYRPTQLATGAPLLLSLHGGTGNRHTIDRGATQGWVRLAEQQGFVLVVPEGQPCLGSDTRRDQHCWNDLRVPGEAQSNADDVGFIDALLRQVETRYATDPRRVFVTGNSNGGLMTYRLLMEFPGRFAAAAAFIANLPVNSVTMRMPAVPTPLMIWSGSADRLMKFGGGEIAGKRGWMRSTPDSVAWWVQANRADAARAQAEPLPDTDPGDGCRVTRTDYPARPTGAPVRHYLAEGGGHAMPSQTESSPEHEGGAIYKFLVGRTCRDVDGPTIAWAFMVENARRPD